MPFATKHPFLIRGAEDRIIDDAAEAEYKSLTPNEQIYREIDYAKLTGEQLVKSSGKFVLLSKVRPWIVIGLSSYVLVTRGETKLIVFAFRLGIISCSRSCKVAATRFVYYIWSFICI